MTSFSVAQPLDANSKPLSLYGFQLENLINLSASNTTAAVPLFRVTGTVEVLALWGIVTTVLGSNVTAAHWRLNDQTAQPVITASAGTTLSAGGVGSFLRKITTAATALTFVTPAAGRFGETAANHITFQPFLITKKTGANTDIEFVYTTTETPTSGAIRFFVRWLPLSSDADISIV